MFLQKFQALEIRHCECTISKLTAPHSLLTYLQRDTRQGTESETVLRHAWKKVLKSARPWSGNSLGDLLGDRENPDKGGWGNCSEVRDVSLSAAAFLPYGRNTDRSNQCTRTHTCAHTCCCTITVKMHPAFSRHRSSSVGSLGFIRQNPGGGK